METELRNRNEGTKEYSIMSFEQDPLKKFQKSKFVKILVRDKIDIRRRKEKK